MMNDAAPPAPVKKSLTDQLRTMAAKPLDAIAGAMVAIGLTPNALTVIGLGISLGAAALAGSGQFMWAGLVMGFGAIFDAFDGAVARKSNRVTKGGALLDSTLDRFGEAAIFAGLGYHFAAEGDAVTVLAAFIALTGSVMVSYTRARSEGLGIANKVGLFTRVERILVMGIALVSGLVIPGLWIVGIGATLTALRRLIHGMASSGGRSA